MDDMRTTRYGYFSTDDLGESTEGKNELGVDCLYVITCMPPFVVALVHNGSPRSTLTCSLTNKARRSSESAFVFYLVFLCLARCVSSLVGDS